VPFGIAVVSGFQTNDGSIQYRVERSREGVQPWLYRMKFTGRGLWNGEPQDFYNDFMMVPNYNPANVRSQAWAPNPRAMVLKFHKADRGTSNVWTYSVYIGSDRLGQTWTYLGR